MAAKKVQKKKGPGNTLTMIGFMVIVGFTICTLYQSAGELREKERAYIEKEETLTKEIAEQEALKKTLEERKKFVTTDQYIEEIAREKLGLLAQDEVLLKENEN